MNRVITQPTALAQWQTLVHEASHKCNITLTTDIENYLTFLLMRHINNSEITKKILAYDMLKSKKMVGKNLQNTLQNIGDCCLILSGLFPKIAEKRRVKISYYVNVGQSSYADLSQKVNNSLTELFSCLSKDFVLLMDVLQAMREINSNKCSMEPLLAYEIWKETKSTNAFKVLQEHIQSKKPIAPFLFDNLIYFKKPFLN